MELGDALIHLKREILLTFLSRDKGSFLYRTDRENR